MQTNVAAIKLKMPRVLSLTVEMTRKHNNWLQGKAERKKRVFPASNCKQGDQIGADFRPLCDCFLWAVFGKMKEVARIFLHSFSSVRVTYALFLTKKHWATFWATFSQTHLVTLVASKLD
jgi:hypothetical protein